MTTSQLSLCRTACTPHRDIRENARTPYLRRSLLL